MENHNERQHNLQLYVMVYGSKSYIPEKIYVSIIYIAFKLKVKVLEDYNIIKSNVGYMSVLSDNMPLPCTVCGFVFFLSQGGILIKITSN